MHIRMRICWDRISIGLSIRQDLNVLFTSLSICVNGKTWHEVRSFALMV